MFNFFFFWRGGIDHDGELIVDCELLDYLLFFSFLEKEDVAGACVIAKR